MLKLLQVVEAKVPLGATSHSSESTALLMRGPADISNEPLYLCITYCIISLSIRFFVSFT
jgi:hypothetical protein